MAEKKSTRGFASHPEHINRDGKTSVQKAQEYKNGEQRAVNAGKALEVQSRMLDALLKDFDNNPEAEYIIEQIKPAVNALIQDAMDREYGRAKQAVDVTSDGERISYPTTIELVAPKHDDSAD